MQRLSRTITPLLLLVAACATTTPRTPPPATSDAGAVADARAALDRGDVRAAHALLEEQLVQEALIQINSLANGGELELALARADELVAMAPAQTSVQDARRRTAVLLAARRLQEARALYAENNVRDAIAVLDQVVITLER